MPLPYNSTDTLRPIGTDNRDEYILVEFHRMLKNTNMSILWNVIDAARKDPEVYYVFPNIKLYADMNDDDRYNATVLFNRPEEFIANLSNEQISLTLSMEYAKLYRHPLRIRRLHFTRMEIIMRQLLRADFVKKLYIFADRFTNEMKAYLVDAFPSEELNKRVVPVEGQLADCLEAAPITTAFVSNSADVIDASELVPGCIDGKYFIIADGYSNYETYGSKDSPKIRYIYDDVFAKWHEQHICTVGHMYPYCINRDTSGRKERMTDSNE